MTIERIAEPCRSCGGPVYTVADWPERAKCGQCGAGYIVTPALRGVRPKGIEADVVTPAHGAGPCRLEGDDEGVDIAERAERFYALRGKPTPPPMRRLWSPPRVQWTRTGWQIVALLAAATLVLSLAALGLALPPRVMLAIGVAVGLCVALYGVWIMAGAIYDERAPPP